MFTDNDTLSLSCFSHEVSNIMSLICCSMQLIEMEHPETENFKHWKTMQSNLNDMMDLLKNLSCYLNSGQIDFIPVDITSLILKLYSSYEPIFTRDNIEFQVQCPDHVLYVLADSDQLYRAILNLTKNALEAVKCSSASKGLVSICLNYDDSNILLTIRDNGCGMSIPDIKNAAMPFYSTKENGTGLGLPLVIETIHRINGKINIQSQPGKGTEITLQFPLADKLSDNTNYNRETGLIHTSKEKVAG